MKSYNKSGFTLIEVVISLMIFTLMSTALLEALSFSVNVYSKGKEYYHTAGDGESLVYKIIEELDALGDGEPAQEELDAICRKFKDKEESYSISICKERYDNLYKIEIIYNSDGKNNICTMKKCG